MTDYTPRTSYAEIATTTVGRLAVRLGSSVPVLAVLLAGCVWQVVELGWTVFTATNVLAVASLYANYLLGRRGDGLYRRVLRLAVGEADDVPTKRHDYSVRVWSYLATVGLVVALAGLVGYARVVAARRGPEVPG